MYLLFTYENTRMKPAEIVLRGEGEKERTMEGVKLRYTVSTHVTITIYSPVQLLR
jgi:hypothetical protein